MPIYNDTSKLVDSLLKTIIICGFTATALVAPNAVQAFDKPLQRYLKKLDKKKQRQEIARLLRYGQQQGLISNKYEHGLEITEKARRRLERADFESLEVLRPKKWDRHWRIVIYDIPEFKKTRRDALSVKLRELNFYQLQRSVWVHPFPCDDEISMIAEAYGIASHLTLFEVTKINNQKRLEEKFADLLIM